METVKRKAKIKINKKKLFWIPVIIIGYVIFFPSGCGWIDDIMHPLNFVKHKVIPFRRDIAISNFKSVDIGKVTSGVEGDKPIIKHEGLSGIDPQSIIKTRVMEHITYDRKIQNYIS